MRPARNQSHQAVAAREKTASGIHAETNLEICILAGGLSTRMGRDKAGVRFRGRTMLAHIRSIAQQTGFPVRVIRRDIVPRCGPLGGVITGLRTTRAKGVLFLACDMPFVTCGLLQRIVTASRQRHAVFAGAGERAGFPFALHRDLLPALEKQRLAGDWSLRTTARDLDAYHVRSSARELENINTPEELERVAALAG